MKRFSEKDFEDIKYEVQEGRLTMSGTRNTLLIFLLYSGFLVGLSFAVANANTIGWNNLSQWWHGIYYIEAVLFALQIFILLFCWENNSFNQKILSISRVVYTYKVALDPFLLINVCER
ncbi:hypothetical protein [Fictibacillus gelatini]|uniref:hypothetical protein n=1 Tax=Fictibacillus gelatini TaxID=225985 RepID=UPI000411BFD7|nr:hypothetical protein [Fictibacillus gelatini]